MKKCRKSRKICLGNGISNRIIATSIAKRYTAGICEDELQSTSKTFHSYELHLKFWKQYIYLLTSNHLSSQEVCMPQGRKKFDEREKQAVLERLWLTYYNDTLFSRGLITEEQRNKMRILINNRQAQRAQKL